MTNDCNKNCTGKGLCLNSTCYCNQGYSYYDCSLTYKQYKLLGYKLQDYIKTYIIIAGAGFFIMMMYICVKKIKGGSDDYIKLD